MSEGTKSFIITLKDSASPAAIKEYIASLGGKITHEYNLIKGYAVTLPTHKAGVLSEHEHIATVEEDKEVSINKD